MICILRTSREGVLMPPTVPDMPIREAPQIPLVIYTVLMCVITLGFLV